MLRNHVICLFFIGQLVAVPPARIPTELYQQFTMDGQITVQYFYLDGTIVKSQPKVYLKATIDQLLEQVKQRKTFYYSATDYWLYQALEVYSIKRQKVAIFGSVQPVYEAICLFYGGIPITIEYNKWVTDHPDLRCMTPAEYAQQPMIFDAAFSISSFEHDGLGRYGDPINPWADLEIMQAVQKMIKPNGLLFLAVPVARDCLVWNAHRIYGKIRLPLLLKDWELVACFGITGLEDPIFSTQSHKDPIQPILVLRNK